MNGKALLLSLILLPLAALAQTPVIQISGANFRPLPLAVPAPLVQGEPGKASQAVDDAFQFDLRACGLFQVLDRASFLADPKEGLVAGSINFSRWSDVGAESLVKYSLAQDGNTLRAEARVFNVGSGHEEFKTSQSAPAAQASQLAHKVADAIYRYYTREPSPFLSHIAYVRRTSGNNKDVWVADWDGRNGRQLTHGGINVLPALGPDELVGYTSYQAGKPELYIQKGGADTVRLKTPEGEMATGIAFSPDGKRIAYALADGESAQIWVAGVSGEGAKAITDTRFGINTSPVWSPDGKRIAFVSNRGGSPQVYVMEADGANVRRLTFQGNYNQTPDWSPRGDLIAFTARDERNAFDLFTVSVDSGKITRLTQDQGNNEEPTFSPNGRLLLFTSTRNGAAQPFVMTVDGNNQVPLPVQDKSAITTPDWGR